MKVAVSNHVVLRNDMGRFRAACSEAASRVVDKAIIEGAELSRGFAPHGHKVDPRTMPLHQSIQPVKLSRTQGVWISEARHALAVEYGAAPHTITPDVNFYWEAAGRQWVPGEIYPGQMIHHPGNEAQPFLRPAYEIIKHRMIELAKREYPG